MEIIEKVQSIVRDPIGQIVSRVAAKSRMEYPDTIRLKNEIESSNPTTIFRPKEIVWFMYNFSLWLSLINSPAGSKIFLEFHKYANNIYNLSHRLGITRKTIYKWVNRLKKCDWLCIDTMGSTGNQILLYLNKTKFPNLTFLTRWFILENIAKDRKKLF
jgi:hypothetical protein